MYRKNKRSARLHVLEVVKVGYRKLVLLHGHVTSEVYQDAISVVLLFVKRHGMLAAGRGDMSHIKIDTGVRVEDGCACADTVAGEFSGPQPGGEYVVDCVEGSVEKAMPIATKDELWGVWFSLPGMECRSNKWINW